MEPLALPIRARFIPFPGPRIARLTGVCRISPAGQFFTVLLTTGGRLALFVPAACRVPKYGPVL